MELIEAIKSRKSIRGYLPKPVPKDILTQILETATCAPSNDNAQPWGFYVLGGKALGDLRKAVEEQFIAGVTPNMDFPEPVFSGVYRDRRVELGKTIFQLMDIPREDKEKRRNWISKMIRLFDAPNAIIITLENLGEPKSDSYFMFSIGGLNQNIALLALNFGLGTCVDLAAVLYPDVIKKQLGIPPSRKIAAAVSIGYPDWDYPANKLRSKREPLGNISAWHGM